MNYLSAENISKSFGDKWLFRNVTFGLNRGDKIALIGANGTGKTTFMNVLMGNIPPEEGAVSLRKDVRVGYLDQSPDFDARLPVSEWLFSGDNPVAQAVKAYEKALIKHNDEEFNRALEQMEANQAWDFEAKVKEILGKLGLHDVEQPFGQLSGGQRKRAALAKVLIDEPELFVLDEPTNHLDLETIEWLENYLSAQNITLLLVTHDRYFLDKVCNGLVELANGNLYPYKGNYAYYLEKRAEQDAINASTLDKDRQRLKKELDWIRRQPKARGTKAQYRIDAFDELKDKVGGTRREEKFELNIKATRLGSKIVELESVGKDFGDKRLIHNFLYTFKKGDRIGIVGKNGAGKSTLLNLITGGIRPDNGKVVVGDTVQFGYYTQSDLVFNDNQRVLDVVKEIAEVVKLGTGETITASQFLNLFLFPPARQHDMVAKLSGGEKRRLQLLKVLIQNPNFLILDEPTNDLDISSLNVLEDFLMNFPGCLLIVSHDRYFMDRLVDHLFVFEENGHLRDYPGNYTDYRNWLEDQEPVGKENGKPRTTEAKAPAIVATKSEPFELKRKLSFNEKKEFETLELEMAQLEKRKNGLIEQLNAGSSNHEQLADWAKQIKQMTEEIEMKELRWLELSEFAA
ncbi:MAG: ABC transporter ATP-binding protein [Runella slithyformis]|nr:MAG: ABC transporter ATP-binding protein [Runella sp.]TAG21530.1 MAG: ABC transporter ATP-binding protein [Cytophagales bacterium]TAG40783.1 MAG: ABC transporter ATP-binding protein [Cytophagia bacterium]TAG71892.1 MAG: ABC transporter ATP-binding protein [Runella slithyformis]TAG82294.1 MAG: ABC transporter ATP-binding protein [Cytophagales bacterium]